MGSYGKAGACGFVRNVSSHIGCSAASKMHRQDFLEWLQGLLCSTKWCWN